MGTWQKKHNFKFSVVSPREKSEPPLALHSGDQLLSPLVTRACLSVGSMRGKLIVFIFFHFLFSVLLSFVVLDDFWKAGLDLDLEFWLKYDGWWIVLPSGGVSFWRVIGILFLSFGEDHVEVEGYALPWFQRRGASALLFFVSWVFES